MTHDEYSRIDGINWSTLKAMRESAKAYKHGLEVKRPDTAALQFGRLVHSLVLTPDDVDSTYTVWTGGTRRGKEWEAFCEQHSGREIVSASEMLLARDIRDAVLENEPAAKLLQGAQTEVPVVWDDPSTGLRCKARIDGSHRDKDCIFDLKTSTTIDARRFGNQAAALGYHLQMAHYRAGIRSAYGWTPACKLIVVDKNPPHDVAVFAIKEDDIAIGAEEVADLLHMVSLCLDLNRWPGRYETEQVLELPDYARGEVEFEYA